jgi:hypothetical protein
MQSTEETLLMDANMQGNVEKDRQRQSSKRAAKLPMAAKLGVLSPNTPVTPSVGLKAEDGGASPPEHGADEQSNFLYEKKEKTGRIEFVCDGCNFEFPYVSRIL